MSAQNPYAPQKQVNQADPLNPKAPTQPQSAPSTLLNQTNGGILPPQSSVPSQPVSDSSSPYAVPNKSPTQPLATPAIESTVKTVTVAPTPVIAPAPNIVAPSSPYAVANENPSQPLAKQSITPGVSSPLPPVSPNFVAPTIQNIFTNPLGVASTALDLFSLGVSKAKGPVGTFLNLETGGAINMLNQQTQIRNAMGGIAGVKAEPLIPLRNSTQQTGATVNTIGEAVEISAVAPVIGSAIGIGAGGVVAGEALGIGINQGFKFYNQGLNTKGLLTPTEIATSAAEGGVLSLVGGGIFKGIGVAGKALDIGLPSGKIGAVTSILGRAGVNAGISGTTGLITSGGDPNAAEQGLAFGALFSAGMEPIGYLGARVPTIKYGGASVPFTDTLGEEVYSGEASFKGLYYGRGADAKPLLGTWDNLPGEGARVQPTLGETPGYQPKSPLQAEVTRRVMLETGTSKETIDINRKAVDVTMAAKGVRNPQLFQDYLPKETGTSTVGEVSELKSYIIQNKDVVAKVFGKASSIPQENPDFGYEVMDANGQVKSSVRPTADFDIQLKSGITQERVTAFAKGAFDIYAKNPEANATMKPGKSLINTTPVELRGTGSDVTAHAVDIHSDFDKIMNPQQPGGGQVGDKTWGIPITEKPRLIENIPTANIKEQVAAKFSSVFNVNDEGEFGPVPHRAKDIPDFLMDVKTLVDQRSNPTVKAKGMANLQDIADYFGAGKIGDLKPTAPQTEEYIVSRPSSSTSRVNNPFASMPSSPASRGNNGLLDIPQSYPSQGNRNNKTQPSLIPSVSSRSNNDYLGLPSYLDTGYPTAKQPSYPTFPSEDPQIYSRPSLVPFTTTPSRPSPNPYPTYPKPTTEPYPIPGYPPPSTKSADKNNPFFPGNKFESGGSSLNPFKISGLDTRKRVYPIFSGEEVLKI